MRATAEILISARQSKVKNIVDIFGDSLVCEDGARLGAGGGREQDWAEGTLGSIPDWSRLCHFEPPVTSWPDCCPAPPRRQHTAWFWPAGNPLFSLTSPTKSKSNYIVHLQRAELVTALAQLGPNFRSNFATAPLWPDHLNESYPIS